MSDLDVTNEPPPKPNESDCCGSGCNPCIFDAYELQLERYTANKNYSRRCESPYGRVTTTTSYTPFTLCERKQHTPQTIICTFRYETTDDDADCWFGYDPGEYFLLRSGDGKFTRAYTPIPSKTYDRFEFTVLIKLYENGLMSRYLAQLAVGEKTVWRGPYGNYRYSHDLDYKYILGLAQGTGIAPIYAVFDAMKNSDFSFLKLFCCYRDSDEFLLHDELYAMAAHWNFQYEVFFSRDPTPKCVKYNEVVHSRRLCASDVQNYLSKRALYDTKVLICGGKEFSDSWQQIVKDCNVLGKNIYVF